MSSSLNRRSLLVRSALGISVATLATIERPALANTANPTPAPAPDGPFTLPDLPFAFAALEPHIDAMTMEIHHDKHHATYVKNLNIALADAPDLHGLPIAELVSTLDAVPEAIRTAVRNNGGGHLNHTLFWEAMAPTGSGGSPSGDLATAIDRDLGGMDAMKQTLNEAGTKRFGSGWAWLVTNDGTLSILSTPNQDSPLMDGSGIPILGVDVWEHAYYLHYQNRRADYLAAWWNVVNWEIVSARYSG